MCNTCDFKVEANRNYISVQKILQHRDQCILRITCPQCDKKFKEQITLKRHMRNEHSVISGSTSPPFKKKRTDIKEHLAEAWKFRVVYYHRIIHPTIYTHKKIKGLFKGR